MKTKTIVALASLLATGLGHAAISFTGTAVTGLSTNAPAGTLLLLIADTGSDGFLGRAGLAGDLTAAADVPKLTPGQVSTTIGETFGGDLVLAKLAVTTGGALNGGFTFDNAAISQGKNFAIVYLPSLAIGAASIPGGTNYGIIKGSDWALTSDNTGQSFGFSTTDSPTSYFRVTLSAGVATNDSFATATPSFQIVPEPSAALLGAIGALGLLRRRRI